MSLILKKLFIGNLNDASNPYFITNNNITLIINCCSECNVNYSELGLNGISVYKIDLLDHPSQLLDFDKLIGILKVIDYYLENDKGSVLVHCFAGVSRSVSIVVAYLIWKYRIPVSEALFYIRKYRPISNPNEGFISQLLEFEMKLNINYVNPIQ